ncbi:hypothetical protein HN51_019933 [Arachis hypogaea]|uniref:Knottin scorpion toxin-like domain-containing protein n=1 Tax=Arachis hypogaea TaxID=3818 RepID=A0A445BYP2_ARAHY|nr:hypothetical protein Ahy_A08g040271 [Arachis hypogaea]
MANRFTLYATLLLLFTSSTLMVMGGSENNLRPTKTCEEGTPEYGYCKDKNCNAECVKKYPKKGTVGFCYYIRDPIYSTCLCQYPC